MPEGEHTDAEGQSRSAHSGSARGSHAGGPHDLATLRQLAESGEVETVLVGFPDLQGRLVGKRVTAHYFSERVAEHGIDSCDYLLGVDIDVTPRPGYRFTGWETGYGDMHAQPDPTSVFGLPWLPATALVLCDLTAEGGAPVEVSPRRILRRQIERAAERGLHVRGATELELYLFFESYDEASAKSWQGLRPLSTTIQDYQLLQTTPEETILRRVRRDLGAAGVPVEHTKGEAGRGQHEVNVAYTDALGAADRHLVVKQAVKEIAAQEGHAASFMAKWSMAEAGSSCHLHTSLWDAAGKPLVTDTSPEGLSVTGRRFLAGQLFSARQLAWCFAPYVNSYRRYVAQSWAPTAVVWGFDNRTCAFRVVGSGASRRVESRVPGADVNPYLALAAAIAGGLYGIDHELEPGEAWTGDAYGATGVPRLPTSLAEALEALEASKVAHEAFGTDVHHHLVNTARQEWAAANEVVTDWELARNFERS